MPNNYPMQGDPLSPHARDHNAKLYGVVVGIVTDNVHPPDCPNCPGDSYSVRVRFPWLPGTDQSWWARLTNFMSGKERGAFWKPEVNDEVLCAFEHGDFNHPIVIGCLWNGLDVPTYTTEDASGKVTWASIQGK